MAHSVAIVNFLPDAGHVLPLLRVAAAFSEHGYDVVCYLPQECEKYLNGYNFQFVSLGSVFSTTTKDAYTKMLCKLSRRSVFYNAFSSYVDMSFSFWEPLKFKVSRQFSLVRSRLAEQCPLFLLCDDHIFLRWYVKLSQDLATPLVLHTFEGHRHCQDLYVQIYGISNLPRQWQVLVEALGMVSKHLFGLRRRIRRFGAHVKGVMNVEEAMERTFASATCMDGDGSRQPIAISTGCGYLEQRYLRSELRICHGPRAFGPLRPKAALQLPSELREWLEESNEPVVYVSFGSMIHLDSSIVKAILSGLALLNVRVLWSMPEDQQDELLPELDVPASVRFEDFVPPLEVLAMPIVRCSINHGGAGSVQDCLLSGKPMLCIPFMWDQPFNSSVVSHLKVGKRLWRRHVSARTIARAVKPLLDDNQFALRASNLATELQHSSSESDVVEYILSQPSVLSRTRMSSEAEVDFIRRCSIGERVV